VVVDPGFGFGKSFDHNLALFRGLAEVRVHGLPLLVGLSRKSMIGAITGRPVADRVVGSVTAALLAVRRGADILRVHDVDATVDALKVLAAIAEERPGYGEQVGIL
jgi:dihydropteroate synthase